MNRVLKDVSNTCDIAIGGKPKDLFGKTFYCSNERLKDLFNNFSLEDKDVFTVLASGDHYFHAYYNGAKKVDTFDRNKLTLYYFYIRKWIIEYYDRYYPARGLLFDTKNYIKKLLDVVECRSEDEKKAFAFWKIFIDKDINLVDNNIFFFSKYIEDNEIKDNERLREIVNKPLSFIQEDVGIRVKKDKKYDLIVASNLLEYIHEPLQLKRVRNNFNSILNDGGQIICSYVIDDEEIGVIKRQKDIFSKYFDVREFPYSGRDDYYKGRPLGYCYTKR